MYATPHTLAGFTIVKAFEDNLVIGIPLAIISHLALDYINERGLSEEDRFTFDLIPSLFCYAIALFTGNFWIFLLGSVAGNLPDLIDKKLYLSIFIPSKFKSTHYLHWQKPLLNPHPNVTKTIGPVSAIIITIILLMF
jgi:hypothetical protein